MKQIFTLFLIIIASKTGYSQVGGYGFGQVVNAASTITGGLMNAKAEQNRKKDEQSYMEYITWGDTLINQKKYGESIFAYNEALAIIPDQQYPLDQIERARIALARLNKDDYQLLVDKADSLYARMEYEEAIQVFNQALAQKREQYPQDRILKANTEIARLKTIHFSGLLISDTRTDDVSSKAYSADPYSDFIKPGKYEWIDRYLVYSNFQTLDGIAVPAGTRLLIYSERNMNGKILLDVTGPAVINNSGLRATAGSEEIQSKPYTSAPRLQETFPPSVRSWSETDMRAWVNGSMEIILL